jgi:hypothetical protein
MEIMTNDESHDDGAPIPGASGGCAITCACLFTLSTVVWPLLFLAGDGIPEPETLLIPIFIGGPAFLVAHIFAVVALRSSNARTASWGTRALRVVWGSIVILILLGVISRVRHPEDWAAAPEPAKSESE